MKNFLHALHKVLKYSMVHPDDPQDEVGRLAYADYLDEHGLSVAAARMRWYARMLNHLRRNINNPVIWARPDRNHGVEDHPSIADYLPEWAHRLSAVAYSNHLLKGWMTEGQQQELKLAERIGLGLVDKQPESPHVENESAYAAAIRRLHSLDTRESPTPHYLMYQHAYEPGSYPLDRHDFAGHVFEYASQNPMPTDEHPEPNPHNI